MGCGLRGLRSLVYKMRQEIRAGRLGPSGSHTGWFKGEGRVGEEEAPVIPLQRQMAEGARWTPGPPTPGEVGVGWGLTAAPSQELEQSTLGRHSREHRA